MGNPLEWVGRHLLTGLKRAGGFLDETANTYAYGPGYKERGVLNALAAVRKSESQGYQVEDERVNSLTTRAKYDALRKAAARKFPSMAEDEALPTYLADQMDETQRLQTLGTEALAGYRTGLGQGKKVRIGTDTATLFGIDPGEYDEKVFQALATLKNTEERGENSMDLAKYRTANPSAQSSRPYYQFFTDAQGNVSYRADTKGAGVLEPLPGAEGIEARRSQVPLPSNTQQDQISGFASAIEDLGSVNQLVAKLPTLGPIWGRIKNVSIEKLGGAGATPEEKEQYVILRSYVRDQAFANGGKQLTGTEKVEYTAVLPNLTDTPEQAIIQGRTALEILRRHYRNKMLAVPEAQRKLYNPKFLEMSGVSGAGGADVNASARAKLAKLEEARRRLGGQ